MRQNLSASATVRGLEQGCPAGCTAGNRERFVIVIVIFIITVTVIVKFVIVVAIRVVLPFFYHDCETPAGLWRGEEPLPLHVSTTPPDHHRLSFPHLLSSACPPA
mmetsp:Transcript_8651/g.13722  ORF Transcript_8651/g.13722 Transcript_8651/m.13722 type:complete len:105 (+) Transcript_8651:242-556(+)